jgi:hypothetical protein
MGSTSKQQGGSLWKGSPICFGHRFAVGRHWKDQGIQQLHQYGKEGVEVHLQAW